MSKQKNPDHPHGPRPKWHPGEDDDKGGKPNKIPPSTSPLRGSPWMPTSPDFDK
jgi:hypothetical protein